MTLNIRPGTIGQRDDAFLVQAFDSALPYLESIGSQAQWGTTPFSSKPHVVRGMTEFTARSEATAAREAASSEINGGAPASRQIEEDWTMLLVCDSPSASPETPTSTPPLLADTPYNVPVAAMGLQSSSPDYAAHLTPLVEAHQRDERSIYLQYLIVDRSAEKRGAKVTRGAGAALLQAAKRVAKERGCKWLFADCWSGNGDALVKYYESQGFEAMDSFAVPDKHGPGQPWTGKLLRMPIHADPEAKPQDATS